MVQAGAHGRARRHDPDVARVGLAGTGNRRRAIRGGRCGRFSGDVALRARQPHLVLPVAAPGRGTAAGLAGDRRGPARNGLLATVGRNAATGRAHRRPGPAHRRAGRRRAGGHRRPRLGRSDLARLGPRPPRPGRRDRADQHRGAPADRVARARVDPAGPHGGRPSGVVRVHAGVPDHRGVAEPPAVGPGGAGRLPGAVPRAQPPPGHRRFRRRHPPRRRPPERAGTGRRGVCPARLGRRPGPAVVGTA